ncbi:MAG TPA: ATP-binding protein [Longimicrobiales bacterium]|nr:ATP-binding protein [Longimicrobiales bacterium]
MATNVSDLALVLRSGREVIVHRWLDRIVARVALKRDFVFPSETLIDQVPLLVDGIADYLEQEAEAEITANAPVIAKARELGRLRFQQAFSARQILWEYELLGGIILQYLDEYALTSGGIPEPFVRRLFHALSAVQRATVEEYLAMADEQVREREERLRGFNRAVSHELRNEVGAILGAARMLKEPFVLHDTPRTEQFVSMVINNAERVERVLENLLELSRVDGDARRHRRVRLAHAAGEVARRLRGYAEVNDVRVEVAEDLPCIEVNAATVDLALTNLVANGIKYADPKCTDRRVRVQAALDPARPDLVVVEVMDNGRGVTEEDRPRLFERFFRSRATSNVEGTGLGLSLVREAVERNGGRIWAEFTEAGETVFAFTLPARRAEDRPDG